MYIYVYVYVYIYIYICIYVFFFFCPFRVTPEAHGGSQARGPIGTAAAGLCQGHSNIRPEPRLQPIPQLTATLDP